MLLTKWMFFLAIVLMSVTNRIFITQMHDGYILAAPKSLADRPQAFRRQLEKHSHVFHQKINLDQYPKNSQFYKIGDSSDKNYLQNIKNYCVNKKQNLTLQQNLQQFIKGPCSPVTIVPGILATTLIIDIDCQKLRNYKNGQIFRQCGWDTCSFFGINKPDRQYILWVGIELVLKVSAGMTRCFGDLFGLLYDQNSKEKDYGSRYSDVSGVKSTWFGDSEGTKQYSRCGSNAIRDLSGYNSLLSIMSSQCALQDYGRFIDLLQDMGYISGITYQPLPYDFRYGILASKTPKIFPQVIHNLHKVTGKKVSIVAHSLGTLHTLSGLAFNLTKKQKQQMIREYIPITPPWSGTISAIRNLLYGDPSYFTNALIDTGINQYAQMKFSTTAGATYDLFIRNIFERFQNEQWLSDIKKRIEYEKIPRKISVLEQQNTDKEVGQQQNPIDWFPSKYELCFDQAYKKNPYCEMGLVDFDKQPIFQIEGVKYYATQYSINKLLQQNLPSSIIQKVLDLYQQTKITNKTLHQIPFPGVNTSIIFSTVFDTQIFYKYDRRPDKFSDTNDNQFIQPQKVGYSPGDLTVPSFSPLMFVSKWIYELPKYNNSIKVYQYCGNYKGQKQHYATLSCQCYENPFKNALQCTHPCIISDKYILKFILEKLTNKGQGYHDIDQQNIKVKKFSEEVLYAMKNQCWNLHPGNQF